MKIAYVSHPITKEEKAKYRKTYDKVRDIRFAPTELPAGDKIFKKAKKKVIEQ